MVNLRGMRQVILILIGLVLGLTAGWLVWNTPENEGTPPSEGVGRARFPIPMEDPDGPIGEAVLGGFAKGWPDDFPLPKPAVVKWSVGNGAQAWACFDNRYPPGGLIEVSTEQFYRKLFSSEPYLLLDIERARTETGPGTVGGPRFSRIWFSRHYDLSGTVAIAKDAASLELGGIWCDFTIDVNQQSPGIE